MTKKKTSLKRETRDIPAAPVPEPTFWQRLFGKKPVAGDKVRRAPTLTKDARRNAPAGTPPRASSTRPMSTGADLRRPPALSTMPDDGVARPSRSFVTRKFNAGLVREALLEAIDRAISNPLDSKGERDDLRWVQGLAAKRRMVESFDPKVLAPEQQLRAVHWMSQIERLNPLKLTYWEDLTLTRHMLDTGASREETKPTWLVELGMTIRRLTQAIQQREANPQPMAAKELEMLVPLFERLIMLPTARMEEPWISNLRELCRELDPMKPVFHARHPMFAKEGQKLLTALDGIGEACGVPAPDSF
ncbi:MAG: hypothetical protein VKO21_02325 [Candidatus Sericytochromatia bacterium]|nr:hypothetical protein [Candidatus Sericytochromatia bacterium]